MKTPGILWLLVALNLLMPSATACGQGSRNRERPAPANNENSNGAKIDGIYIHLTYGLMGVGGALSMTYTPYLLFKDGTIYRKLTTPPADLDVAKSRREEPKMWGRWEKSGKSVIVQWNDGKRETWKDQWYITRPARKTDRLNGVYRFITGGGSTSGAMADDIEFSSDGRFVRKGVVSDRNSPLYTTRRSDSGGTYLLDGHTIELRYAGNKVERLAFYFYPDSDNSIGIGERAYSLTK